MRTFIPILLFAGLTLLGACANVPELDAAISESAKDADYPKLVPLGHILAGLDLTEPAESGAFSGGLTLPRQADGTVPALIDAETRARMQAALARYAR